MSHSTTNQHSEVKKKKKGSTKKKKTSKQYCTCRRGYDGKEFMIECDGCQEWFHGDCIGLTPNTAPDQYYCQSCRNKKTLIILKPAKKATLPSPPAVQSIPATNNQDEEEEDDDICILCDGDCTCGQNPSLITRPPTPPKPTTSKSPQFVFNQTVNNVSDDDEEIVVDDLDDLLEAMSPLSTHHTDDSSLSENEELFTDDEQDIEKEETRQIIDDVEEEDDESVDEEDSDESDEEFLSNHDYTFVEDDYEDEKIPDNYRWWSSSSEDEEEEDVEFDFTQDTTEDGSDEDKINQILDTNLYNNITSAFIHALAPSKEGSASTGTNTPITTEDRTFSSQELSNILSTLSAEQRNEDISRRPSLPSSALSAARRLRGSVDMRSSETLRALSTLGLPLTTLEEEAKDESRTSQLPDKILSILTNKDKDATSILSPTSTIHSPLSTLNTLLSDKATTSSRQSYLSSITGLEQLNLDDASLLNKRKANNTLDVNEKKRRSSRSNSFSTFEKRLQPLEINSFSTPVSPSAIMTDPFEDIQFDDEMLSMDASLEQDPDLSRWKRIPIGAFRVMRSNNKLWLER